MATYKVIQDIEAEDKFVGPLTLKQFIFASITVICLYLSFILYTKHLWPGIFLLLPPAIVSGFLGFPWRRDQPTETWLLAKLRFFFKPRKRIWDQSGIKQLVTITVPKHIEKNFTNGLNQTEVQSRLKALANTIDSRGWAVKNVDSSVYSQPSFAGANGDSDRLVDISVLPKAVPTLDPDAANDMLDMANNPVAHQLESMIDASTQSYRQQLVERMHEATNEPTPPITPMATPPLAQTASPIPAAPAGPLTPAEQAVLQQVHQQAAASPTTHLPTLQPLGATKPAAASNPSPTAMTTPVDPAILGLAKNNDLNVATIARQAHQVTEKNLGDDEIVVSLR